MNHLSTFWLIMTIVFIIIEAATPGLVCIWLAAGAAITFVFALFDLPLWLQIIVFIVSSIALIIVTRPLAKKYVYKKTVATNADRIIGAEGIVTHIIDPIDNQGQVKVMGQIWSAKSKDNIVLQEGTEITVTALEGVKAVVSQKQ